MKRSSTLRKNTLAVCLAVCAVPFLHAQTVFFSWSNQTGSTGYDYATSVVVDALGNVYTTGEFRGTVDFDPGSGSANLTSAGADDIFVTKIDGNGSFVWAAKMGGTGTDIGNEIRIDAFNNVYVAGTFEGTADFNPGAGTNNMTSTTNASSFVVKLSGAGNYIWSKMIGSNLGTSCEALAVDAIGVVHLAGDFSGTADLNPDAPVASAVTAGQSDVYLVELDSGGVYQWSKFFGGTSLDHCASIAGDVSGNLYLTGYFSGTCDFEPGAGSTNLTASSTDIYVMQLDPSGDLNWAKQMGGGGSDGGTAITVDFNGDVFTTGYFDGTADFDPGNGTHNFTAGTGISDAFVSKLTTNGVFAWAAQLGGSSVDAGQSIALDPSGNVYTCGRFSLTADFDPSASNGPLTSAGTYDAYVSKLTAAGGYGWAHKIGGAANDVGNCVTVDPSGNVYTTGYFAGTSDFDPQASSWTMVSNGLDDVFLTKWSQSGVGIEENSAGNVSVYPNPSAGMITLTFNTPLENATINVLAVNGQLAQQFTQQSGTTLNLDLGTLTNGVYILEVVNGDVVSRTRFIKH